MGKSRRHHLDVIVAILLGFLMGGRIFTGYLMDFFRLMGHLMG